MELNPILLSNESSKTKGDLFQVWFKWNVENLKKKCPIENTIIFNMLKTPYALNLETEGRRTTPI